MGTRAAGALPPYVRGRQRLDEPERSNALSDPEDLLLPHSARQAIGVREQISLQSAGFHPHASGEAGIAHQSAEPIGIDEALTGQELGDLLGREPLGDRHLMRHDPARFQLPQDFTERHARRELVFPGLETFEGVLHVCQRQKRPGMLDHARLAQGARDVLHTALGLDVDDDRRGHLQAGNGQRGLQIGPHPHRREQQGEEQRKHSSKARREGHPPPVTAVADEG